MYIILNQFWSSPHHICLSFTLFLHKPRMHALPLETGSIIQSFSVWKFRYSSFLCHKREENIPLDQAAKCTLHKDVIYTNVLTQRHPLNQATTFPLISRTYMHVCARACICVGGCVCVSFFFSWRKEEFNIRNEIYFWGREKKWETDQRGNAHIINPKNTLPVFEHVPLCFRQGIQGDFV